jgi:YVTN family beta-propeller protein
MHHDRTVAGILLLGASLAAAGFGVRHQIQIGVQRDGSIVVPNGQLLTPAGTHIEVNDRPLGMVLSPNHKTLAVVTGSNFSARALHLIDTDSRTLTQTVSISNSFVGVGFSPSGDTIYVGGGASNDVKVFTAGAGGAFAAAGTIPIARAEPSGLSVSPNGSRLYVALNMTNEVAVIDTATRSVLQRIPVGTYPYTTVVSADGSKVYATNWGGKIPGPGDVTDGMFPVVVDPRTGIPMTGTVSVIDAASNAVVKTLNVGLHPTGMAMSPSGDRIYVTNANSDTVSEISTATDIVVRRCTSGTEGREAAPAHRRTPSPSRRTDARCSWPTRRRTRLRWSTSTDIPTMGCAADSDRLVLTAVALDATGDRLFIEAVMGLGRLRRRRLRGGAQLSGSGRRDLDSGRPESAGARPVHEAGAREQRRAAAIRRHSFFVGRS